MKYFTSPVGEGTEELVVVVWIEVVVVVVAGTVTGVLVVVAGEPVNVPG